MIGLEEYIHTELCELWMSEYSGMMLPACSKDAFAENAELFEPVFAEVQKLYKIMKDVSIAEKDCALTAALYFLACSKAALKKLDTYGEHCEHNLHDPRKSDWLHLAQMIERGRPYLVLEEGDDYYNEFLKPSELISALCYDDIDLSGIMKRRVHFLMYHTDLLAEEKRQISISMSFPEPESIQDGPNDFNRIWNKMCEDYESILTHVDFMLTRVLDVPCKCIENPLANLPRKEDPDTEIDTDSMVEEKMDVAYSAFLSAGAVGGKQKSNYKQTLAYQMRLLSPADKNRFLQEERVRQEQHFERLMDSLGEKYVGDAHEASLSLYYHFARSPKSCVFPSGVKTSVRSPFTAAVYILFFIRMRMEVLTDLQAALGSAEAPVLKGGFYNYILDKDRTEDLLNNLHMLIDGQKGKQVALVMEVAVEEGLLKKPPFSAIEQEFGDIGTSQAFNSYYRKGLFDDIEKTNIKKVLL